MNSVLYLFIISIMFFGIKFEKIESGVYSFAKARTFKTVNGQTKTLIEGENTHMTNFEIKTNTLNPGTSSFENQITDSEEIIFIREGLINITVNEVKKEMGPGSVALIMPGDEHGISNRGKSQSAYYTIEYKSKKPMDTDRGKSAGGSVLIDWNNIKYQPHDKGGIRRFFDRKSAMSERIEMHVSTLNPAVKSHEPHTHEPAEIVIMMEGTTEMEIGGKIYPGEVGDVYFLGSGIPHAIRNTGSKPCMYLAFQWE